MGEVIFGKPDNLFLSKSLSNVVEYLDGLVLALLCSRFGVLVQARRCGPGTLLQEFTFHLKACQRCTRSHAVFTSCGS